MRNTIICGLAVAFMLSTSTVSAQERDFDTIDNAPEEKERGIQAGQTVSELAKNGDVISLIGFGSFSVSKRVVLADTPNGDKVIRILKKKLPGIID